MRWITALVLCLATSAAAAQPPVPRPIDEKELATYRLTADVLARFAHATRLIAAATRDDARFQDDPLFTEDITKTGDAPEMAAALQRRLDSEPALTTALFAADLDPREYAKFALTLFAARLAHGFVKSGVLRRVPEGVAAANVAFIAAHEKEVAALLRLMRLE